MNRKKIIRRVIVLGAWCLVIIGMTTLLVAANKKKKEHVCKKLMVGIKGSGEKFYIEEADILKQLEKAANGSLVNKPLQHISLALLEKSLEKNQWIRDAELYVDREDVLHVSVEEREPVARIFTTAGSSFYMDSSGHQMPLIEKLSARVPVITGYFPNKRLSSKDSVLLDEVKQVARFIYGDPFWNAQIGQVDITRDRKFELVPVIGDHVIRIGDAENLEGKFGRLLLFYKQVMSRTGFNKYAAVDVQYEGQVIGVNKGTTSAVDSIQLQKNIEELLKKSTIQNVSEDMLASDKPGAATDSVKLNLGTGDNPFPENTDSITAKKPDPIPEKQTETKSIQRKATTADKAKKIVNTNQKPKAVMKRRAN